MPDIVKADLLDHELKKHVAAIHIENRLSLLERKMANVLLLNAYPNLLTQEAHRIRIKDLASILGFDSNDRDCLKRALVNLMSTVLTWNIIDRNGNEKAWRARPMLMSADIERNWCTYAYHPDLRQKCSTRKFIAASTSVFRGNSPAVTPLRSMKTACAIGVLVRPVVVAGGLSQTHRGRRQRLLRRLQAPEQQVD